MVTEVCVSDVNNFSFLLLTRLITCDKIQLCSKYESTKQIVVCTIICEFLYINVKPKVKMKQALNCSTHRKSKALVEVHQG